MEYRESITKETEQEVKDFLTSHPSQHLSYWDWRESNNLILKIYKELEESTKGFGKEITILAYGPIVFCFHVIYQCEWQLFRIYGECS